MKDSQPKSLSPAVPGAHHKADKYNSDYIVDLLTALKVPYIAINPGATYSGLHDSLVNYGGKESPKIILCCHEEIAVAISWGYNLVAEKPMFAAAHDLVGLLHASMAIFNAWVDRAPVFVIGATGPLAVEKRRPWIDWIHTAIDEGKTVRDYTKFDDTALSLPSAIHSITRAYQAMQTEPKGPVYVALETAMQQEPAEGVCEMPDVSRLAAPSCSQPAADCLNQIADLLIASKTPVVMADYLSMKPGVVEKLVELANLLSLPVIDGGRMLSFPSNHPLDMTGAKDDVLGKADLILGLDVFDFYHNTGRFNSETMAPEYNISSKAKVIDISLRQASLKGWAQDYGKLQEVDVNVAASAGATLSPLIDVCRKKIKATPGTSAVIEERGKKYAAAHNKLRAQWKDQAEKSRSLPKITKELLSLDLWEAVRQYDWVLINNANTKFTYPRQLWDISKADQYIGGSNGGGIGYGLGRALGVALAYKNTNRLCVDIQPDGDLNFVTSGLWTAAHHEIPLFIVVYNNRTYGNTRMHQKEEAVRRGRNPANCGSGNDLTNPNIDYPLLAKGYGVHTLGTIDKPADLLAALKEGAAYVSKNRKPVLVDVVVPVQ